MSILAICRKKNICHGDGSYFLLLHTFFSCLINTHDMNCSTVGDLVYIVPTNENSQISITNAPQIIVQSLPVIFGLLLWVVLEFARRKRAVSDNVRRTIRLGTLAGTAAIGLVLWRFTTVLTCQISSQSIVWNLLAVAGLVVSSIFLLFGLTLRRPRIAVVTSLLLASGVVVTDVGLRGWWNVDGSLAAQHLMPVQLLWILHTVTILFHFDRSSSHASTISRGGTATRRNATVVEVVDALARRNSTPSPTVSGACSVRGRERANMRV